MGYFPHLEKVKSTLFRERKISPPLILALLYIIALPEKNECSFFVGFKLKLEIQIFIELSSFIDVLFTNIKHIKIKNFINLKKKLKRNDEGIQYIQKKVL